MQIKPKAARALHRQKIGEQTAVEQVDGERAAADVGAAHFVVGGKHIDAADVAAGALRGDREFADGGGIAQAEIEPLRADRRNDVRGFADQRDAVGGEAAARSRRTAEKARAPARP